MSRQLVLSSRPRGPRARWLSPLVAAMVVVATLLAPPADAATVSARTLLGELTSGSETQAASYDRDAFRHWIDADGDGCDTRAEVLQAESSVATGRTGTCTVTSGRWTSAYDGTSATSASGLDIDHMVPLKEAWISGAASWSASRRQDFANDLGFAASLKAVSASSNRSKSDQDPDSWLPPDASNTCTYVKDWVAVKWRWGLRIDGSEAAAVDAALDDCSSLTVTRPARA